MFCGHADVGKSYAERVVLEGTFLVPFNLCAL